RSKRDWISDVCSSDLDQQIRVNKMMIDAIAGKKNIGKNIRRYMLRYLEIITTVSSIMLIRSGTKENLEKKNELWKYLKNSDIHKIGRATCRKIGGIAI